MHKETIYRYMLLLHKETIVYIYLYMLLYAYHM